MALRLGAAGERPRGTGSGAGAELGQARAALMRQFLGHGRETKQMEAPEPTLTGGPAVCLVQPTPAVEQLDPHQATVISSCLKIPPSGSLPISSEPFAFGTDRTKEPLFLVKRL